MSRKKSLLVIEPWLFWFFLVLSLIPLFLFRWIPSLEGPNNVYTSRIVKSILEGNTLFRSYFDIHFFSSGTGTSLLLSGLLMLFPAWLAEKILIGLILVFQPLAFRYMVKGISGKHNLIYLLIFPFSWNFILLMGYYDFALGLPLLFFSLGWYHRQSGKWSMMTSVFLALWTLLLVWINATIFVGGFLYILLSEIWNKKSRARGFFQMVLLFFRELILVVLVTLPAWILLYIGIYQGDFVNEVQPVLYIDRLKGFFAVRPLIIYVFGTEWKLSILFFIALIFPIITLGINRTESAKSSPAGFLPLFLAILGLMYFLVPSGTFFTGDFIEVKLLLLINSLAILWLAFRNFKEWIQLASVGLMSVSLIWLGWNHIGQIEPLDRQVGKIERMAMQIPENKVVFPVNCSDNWLEKHFFNYLGGCKNLVVLSDVRIVPGEIVTWKPSTQSLLAILKGHSATDTMVFTLPDLISKSDCFVFRYAEDVPMRFPAFGRNLLQQFVPLDSNGSDYPDIYIRKQEVTAAGWKHEAELALKRYFNKTSSSVIDTEYLNLIRIPGDEMPKGERMWLEVRTRLQAVKALPTDSLYLVMMLERNGQRKQYQAVVTSLDSAKLQKDLVLKYRFEEQVLPHDVVKVYFWNPFHATANIQQSMIRVNYFK